MRVSIKTTVTVALTAVALLGCPLLGERFYKQLKFENNDDRTIRVLVNLAYPDSSLRYAIPDLRIYPHDRSYISGMTDLKKVPGVTVMVVDAEYFDSKWHEGVASPDTYLEEDRIRRRYHLSRVDLDSVGWTLSFP